MPITFRGGLHMDEHKNLRKAQIKRMPAPDVVYIPMQQHIGAQCAVGVAVGDYVKMGQKIGDVSSGLGVPVHSSVSGTVKEIIRKNDSTGRTMFTVVIENDHKYEKDEKMVPFGKSLIDTDTDEIVEIVRESGISGMGGAGFPAYAKIQSAIGKVDTLIINCCECEPFLSADHRLIYENPASVVNGARILLKALGITNCYIAIEDNKLDAANKLEKVLVGDDMINVKILKTKYPQGDEKQIVYVITGKEIPTGGLPSAVGCVIFNAETTAAVYNAFAHGTPCIERIVTVDGDCISHPQNVMVPIGTPIKDLIGFCEGFSKEPKTIINGGPMMGRAIWDIESPVTKTTSGVLAFSEKMAVKMYENYACIRCGKCVDACPMHLMPVYLARFTEKKNWEKLKEFDVMSCIECGCCTYICPGRVPIVHLIRTAKGTIKEQQMAERAAAAANRKEI